MEEQQEVSLCRLTEQNKFLRQRLQDRTSQLQDVKERLRQKSNFILSHLPQLKMYEQMSKLKDQYKKQLLEMQEQPEEQEVKQSSSQQLIDQNARLRNRVQELTSKFGELQEELQLQRQQLLRLKGMEKSHRKSIIQIKNLKEELEEYRIKLGSISSN